MLKVRTADRQDVLRLTRRQVTRLLRLAAPPEWDRAEISVTLVDGAEMTELNRRFTGRRGQTDVLAFPLADRLTPEGDTVGEIVVNATRALEEAVARRVDPVHELMLYIVHGAVHLQGYDDHSPAGRRAMYAREAEILEQAGIPYSRYATRRRSRRRTRR